MDVDPANDLYRDHEPTYNEDDEIEHLATTDEDVNSITDERSKAARVNVHDRDLVPQQARWARLSRFYNDQYLDFFIKDSRPAAANTTLTISQYGAVMWTDTEKEAFFSALALKGRHNLTELAAIIGTKSVIEIRDYLDRLKTADAEHQMFAPHAKNVSLADMDAAVEVTEACEERLERAADALAAFQEKYDLAKLKGDGDLWLIETTTAEAIDQENETRERQMENDELPVEAFQSDGVQDNTLCLFHFQTMLELSRALFMNTADGSKHDHWTVCAEDEEEPSLTVDAARMLYNLVKSLTQRVLQTAIFLAHSRISSATTSLYTPTETLKDIDVVAALRVLNLPIDSWDYWTNFPRRSGVDIVLGHHRKGQNNPLTLEQVESTLSVQSSRGRRSSLSSLVSQSSQEGLSGFEGETGEEVSDSSPQNFSEEELSRDGSPSDNADCQNETVTSAGEDYSELEDESASGNRDMASATEHQISRKRRRIMMEELQDEYLERLDRSAQLREEVLLQNLFSPDIIKEEPEEDLPRRPRVPRKTEEDLKDWSERVYYSSWEIEQSREEPAMASP